MTDKVKIAIDAMGGDKAPKKIIEGISISLKSNKDNSFYLYGNQNQIEKEISNLTKSENFVKLLIQLTSSLTKKVLLLQQKKGKKQACGKQLNLKKII